MAGIQPNPTTILQARSTDGKPALGNAGSVGTGIVAVSLIMQGLKASTQQRYTKAAVMIPS